MSFRKVFEDISGSCRVLDQQLHTPIGELLPSFHVATHFEVLFHHCRRTLLLFLHLLRGYRYYI